jgi:hypothetical protein
VSKHGKGSKTQKPAGNFVKSVKVGEAVDMDIFEYDYYLEFPGVNRTFTEVEQKVIMDVFQSTYNSLFTRLVVLEAEATDQTYVEPEAGTRNLQGRRNNRRFSLMRMRLRASGPNANAKRPLIRTNSKRNRVLFPGDSTDFFSALERRLKQATAENLLPKTFGTDAIHIQTTESDKKPEEGFYSFSAKMKLKNMGTRLNDAQVKEVKKDFQISYNEVYNKESLVVHVKKMKQYLGNQTWGNQIDPTLHCDFKGTLYTNNKNATQDHFKTFKGPSLSGLPAGTRWSVWKNKRRMFLADFDGMLQAAARAGWIARFAGNE